MQWSDEVRIETPEQIDVALEVAGLGSRFVAQLYDWGVKWGVWTLVALLALIVSAILGLDTSSRPVQIALGTVLVVLFYVFLLGFDIFYEVRRNGQTPGKRVAGIRVVKEGGAPVDFTSAGIRNLLGLADFLPFFYLLGGLVILISPRGQRLGDMAAGTLVIRERALALPVDHLDVARGLASEEFHFTAPQLAACSAADRTLLKHFFERGPTMEPGPREQLALRLSAQYLRKTGYEPAAPIRDGQRAEAWLASLYRDLDASLDYLPR